MKKFLLLFIGLTIMQFGSAQPTNLTTDLLEHTDRVFLDGYISNVSLEDINVARTVIERYQTAQIRSDKPRLGWVVNGDKPNTRQTAYRILMASSTEILAKDEGNIWDSGKTDSDNSVSILYAGKPLESSKTYFWKVKTWDNYGVESVWSQPKGFITATTLDGKTARYPLQISEQTPVKMQPISNTLTFIDFGKAAFGTVKLTLSSQKDTDSSTIRLGESVKNGRIDRQPGGTIRFAEYKLPLIKGTHTYTVKIRPDKRNTSQSANESGVIAILMPDYTGEVMPFRYCEVESAEAPKSAVRRMVHYPFDNSAATFHSSDDILNQIWELCKYSIIATSFTGVYIDGDRERIPYEGDAYINQLCHYSTDREYSLARHSIEHLLKYPTWPTDEMLAMIPVVWNDYLYTGNSAILEQYYELLTAKTLSGLRETNGLISTRTGKVTPEFCATINYKGKRIADLVDWPQAGGFGAVGESDGFVFTDYNTVVNALYYENMRLISLIAKALNKTDDEIKFAKEADNVKRQFNALLLDKKKNIYRDGIDTEHSALHSNMFAQEYGLPPAKSAASVAEFIRSRKMACSVYGAQHLLDAVYRYGDADYGLELMTSTTDRSWFNMIRVGSTITLEAWDNKYKPNQDWNHAWGAAPANIIPRWLMGIQPLEAGFKRVRIQPQPSSLRHAEMSLPTVRGTIHVAFDNTPDGVFALEISIPANMTAEVVLPVQDPWHYNLTVKGTSLKPTKRKGKNLILEAGSGTTRYTVEGMRRD
ncbi:MAG: alpha-L-rhamnosidase [Tannerella sp.]|nr:alpha-L-rhamnosidase [Tannerella sp.]